MLELSDQRLKDKKGLVGGDIERLPQNKRGLKPYLDFDDFPVEIRRFWETEREKIEAEQFLSHRPIEVEIGFGKGQFILDRAQKNSQIHFIGFEIRRQLCLSLAKKIRALKLKNLRIIYEDARVALPQLFPDNSLSRCYIFFPDPWWKKRHAKRRILTPPFLKLLAKKLQPQGILQIKTDVKPYAEQIKELLSEIPQLEEISPPPELTENLPTEREEFCLKEGLPVFTFTLRPSEKIEN